MKESFILYQSFYPPIKGLTDEEKGAILDAVFQYHSGCQIRELSQVCQMAFNFMKPHFDRNNDKYEKIVERNRMNGLKGIKEKNMPMDPNGVNKMPMDPKIADNDNDNDNEKISHREYDFSPPTLEEIQKYFSETIVNKSSSLNPAIEAVKFESFYSSKNWMVGKNKMTNWKKSISSWIANKKNNAPKQPLSEIEINPDWQ